ncbi:Hypothetical Protein NTJ_01862 [Nesidiocoris tenuis]|uniref:Enhancer of yellow 2 transcription factor n=1 Tax=Nesidiocoris tenuis TaxID=355587 RepID=A0ABN7ACT2_9HEMI|nr:Hypothetical Protein NTJ_01862 [Nesidiocoris tenuis]
MLEVKNDQLAMLMASGEYDRFKNLLRSRLRECGWVDEVHMMCRQTRRNSDMTLNDLYAEVAKKSRAMVPASVKRELLVRVKESLLQSNGYYDDNIPTN